MASTERFGYEWNKYSHMDQNYEKQIKNWVSPLTPDDFKNKSILDAGCGMGRNSFWALKWGASELTAFDFDERSIKAAKNTLKDFSNVKIEFRDINKIDWTEKFDLGFSIGVVHHLNNPELAIRNLFRSIKPGGKLLLWVYSFEGNEWIVKYINPIRINFTSKLPLPLVHFLSYFASIPLWAITRFYKNKPGYFGQLSNFKLDHITSIVFDQLIPSVANYWSRTDIENLLKNSEIEKYSINQPPNKCGWTVIIEKKLS